jgi:hypothetical protein
MRPDRRVLHSSSEESSPRAASSREREVACHYLGAAVGDATALTLLTTPAS